MFSHDRGEALDVEVDVEHDNGDRLVRPVEIRGIPRLPSDGGGADRSEVTKRLTNASGEGDGSHDPSSDTVPSAARRTASR